MRWLALFLVGCSPPVYPTPGGLEVELFDGAKPADVDVAELDQLWSDVVRCIPPRLVCRNDKPRVRISGKERVTTPYFQEVTGYTLSNAVVLARGYNDFAHECVHWRTCVLGNNELTKTCGDDLQ